MYLVNEIRRKDLSDFEGLIPDNYIEQVKEGKFFAGRLYDQVGGEEIDEAIFVTCLVSGWLEFVWIHFFHDDDLPVARANIMRCMIRIENERRGVPLKGVFMDVHYDEIDDPVTYRQMLYMADFEIREILGNTYEFSFEQVKQAAFLKKTSKLLPCLPLDQAEDSVFTELATLIREDDRPVPVGAFPKWDHYLLSDSLVCMKDNKVCGALLVSMQEGSLVLECAYVIDKMALSVMLGKAYTLLSEKYGASQRVLVPVVLKKTGTIVEQMVPDAKRIRMLEALQWF